MGSQRRNWSGSLHFQPEEIVSPEMEEAPAEIVRAARDDGLKLRAVGQGHSSSPNAIAGTMAFPFD